jgi:hypothetical protein
MLLEMPLRHAICTLDYFSLENDFASQHARKSCNYVTYSVYADGVAQSKG